MQTVKTQLRAGSSLIKVYTAWKQSGSTLFAILSAFLNALLYVKSHSLKFRITFSIFRKFDSVFVRRFYYYVSPCRVGRHIVFALAVCLSQKKSVTNHVCSVTQKPFEVFS